VETVTFVEFYQGPLEFVAFWSAWGLAMLTGSFFKAVL